jgi:hypothetical protein
MLIVLTTIEHPVKISTALYRLAPYSALSTIFKRRPELIGPARTFPSPYPKQKTAKVASAAVGPSVIAVPTLTRIEDNRSRKSRRRGQRKSEEQGNVQVPECN